MSKVPSDSERLSKIGKAIDDSILEASEKELREEHLRELRDLLTRAGIDDVDPGEFRRYGSARRLYNFKIDYAY